MASRLYRSSSNKVVAGVCGGLGEYFDIDPTLLRLIVVVATVAGFGMTIPFYLLGWIVIPQRYPGDPGVEPAASTPSAERSSDSKLRTYLPGLILVALGCIFLMREYFYWFSFSDIWPVALVAIGLFMILRHRKQKPDDDTTNDQHPGGPTPGNREGESL
jgi:phage shock protein PspC (stress-responsive transcriptional regulator)